MKIFRHSLLSDISLNCLTEPRSEAIIEAEDDNKQFKRSPRMRKVNFILPLVICLLMGGQKPDITSLPCCTPTLYFGTAGTNVAAGTAWVNYSAYCNGSGINTCSFEIIGGIGKWNAITNSYDIYSGPDDYTFTINCNTSLSSAATWDISGYPPGNYIFLVSAYTDGTGYLIGSSWVTWTVN
jgi:hypothetical protein